MDAAPADAAEGEAQAFDAVLTAPATEYQQRVRLAGAAAEMDRTEIIAALEREHARFAADGTKRIPPTEALLARFAELDPAAAVGWLAQSYPVDEIEEAWLSVVLDAWTARDADAAFAWARGLPSGTLRERVSGDLIDRLAARDPAEALRRFAALPGESPYNLSPVFLKLAEKDLRAACEQAAQLPPDREEVAVSSIVQVWAKRQPAEAYGWITQFPAGSLHDTAMRQLYSAWGDQDPAAAAGWLMAHRGADVGNYLSELAGKWTRRDLASARAWSEQLPAQLRMSAVSAVVSTWDETDPRAATEYVMALPVGLRTSLISSPLMRWAENDLAGARAWMEKAPANVYGSVAAAVCSAWCSQDAHACADYLLTRPGDKVLREQLQQAVSTWATRSPDEVWQWAQGVADPKQRATAQSTVLEILSRSDPAGAAARLGQLPPDVQTTASSQVASQWAAVDPPAAARWVEGLPAGDAREEAMNALVSQWAGYDGPAVAAWLDGQPPGAARDGGVTAMLRSRPDTMEPDAALRLARTVQDADKRAEALTGVVANWLEQDRAAATAWLQQSGDFTPEQRAQLLQSTDGGDGEEQTAVTE